MRAAFVSVHGCPVARLGEKDTGGMNVFLRETAKELGRRGVGVDIYTRAHDPNDPQVVELGENARVIHLAAGPLSETKRSLHQRLPEFTKNLHEFVEANHLRYDLVHGHYWLSGPVALSLRGRWRVPLVASFHTLGMVQRLVRAGEPDSEHRIATEQAVVRSADRLVLASPQEREQLIRLYGADPDRAHVVPCGYDRDLFKPMEKARARRELGLHEDKIVLFVGRMERIKGLDVLLRAVAALEESESVRMVIVGGSEGDAELARLRRLAMELGVLDRLLFVGPVPQSTLPLYYNAADVCVAPSFYETFGMVALEAMACGTPVIAARVGGLQATIADGKTGFLVPWHCPEPYTERLEVILGNDLLRENLGRAARDSVGGLDWASVADRLLEVYDRALGGRLDALQSAGCA